MVFLGHLVYLVGAVYRAVVGFLAGVVCQDLVFLALAGGREYQGSVDGRALVANRDLVGGQVNLVLVVGRGNRVNQDSAAGLALVANQDLVDGRGLVANRGLVAGQDNQDSVVIRDLVFPDLAVGREFLDSVDLQAHLVFRVLVVGPVYQEQAV